MNKQEKIRMKKNTNDQDDVLFWVNRDDNGTIVDWGMILKDTDAANLLEKLVDDLKREGKQVSVKQYEAVRDHMRKAEKTDSKKKHQKK